MAPNGTVHVAFLGLGDFDIKVFRMASKAGGKSDHFTTDDQWKLQLPSLLDGTGSEMNSMYSKCICIVCQVVPRGALERNVSFSPAPPSG